jgi:hypothetical protein
VTDQIRSEEIRSEVKSDQGGDQIIDQREARDDQKKDMIRERNMRRTDRSLRVA